MSRYTLEEVTSKRTQREFIELPKRLYKKEPYFICPPDPEIQGRFDPAVNELLQDGEAIRWIVRDEKGEVAGRIGAFYNRSLVACSEGQPTGGCGFFESINNQEVANLLFDASRDWLKSKGLEAMDGPINFGSRDQWWGLLVKGFDSKPLYGCPYNFEYYISLFENYGFKNYFDQHTYLRELKTGMFPENVYERVKRLKEEPSYEFKHIKKQDLPKYADAFLKIYNAAWVNFPGIRPMQPNQAQKMMKTLRPIVDERLIYFAFHHGEPVGFFIMIPDLNLVFEPFNGRFGLVEKLRFLWRLRVAKKADRIIGLVFGVLPEYHGRGLESGIIYAFEEEVASGRLTQYKSLELTWVGDFNPLMMRMVESLVNGKQFKLHTTYRYLFDRDKEFHRAPKLGRKPKAVQSQPNTEAAS